MVNKTLMANKKNKGLKSEMQSTQEHHQNSLTSKTGYKEQELVPSRKNLKK